MIPLFVVDRPASLRILGGLTEDKGEFGILAHAFTTRNFKKQFAEFDLAALKIGDSGIYQKNDQGYKEIFSAYSEMKVDYGIIKDYYRDKKRTFDSAKKALREYKNGNYSFKLIGVAQGESVAEYLQSYREQKDIGLEVVAIGGLLDKVQNHVRMVKVKHDVMLKNVIRAIRINYPEDRIFPLGVFNKNRLNFFNEIEVWASDYKGWIFRYDRAQADIKGDRFEQTRTYIRDMILKPINSDGVNDLLDSRGYTNAEGKRLLIMACGKAKKNEAGKAINVYDGPTFKAVRKYLRSGNNHLDVKIISAKYGLIGSNDKISPYDLKLNAKTSRIYKEIYDCDLSREIHSYNDIFVVGGKHYQSVVPSASNVTRAEGKNGFQLSQLINWLNSDPTSNKEKVNSRSPVNSI